MFQRIWKMLMGSSDAENGEPPIMYYRGYRIERNPYQWMDDRWMFSHEDYDGPGDNRFGTAATVEEAKREIDFIEDDD